MWFTLPPRLLPAAVAAALLAGQLPKLVRRQIAPESLLLLLTSSWYALGPAAVLYFAGAERVPRWSHWYVYLGALAAQFAVNFVAAMPPARAALSLGARAQLRLMAPSFAVDAALAPLGILLAFPAAQHPLSLLLAMPLVALLGFFARERQVRIDHALELSHAYRGTALLLGDVIEADDAYTGSHSRDVVELVLGVADRLGLAPVERRHAEFAALLHDVGKVRIPSEIINKPGALDPEERAIINTHTLEGERMLEKVGGLLGIVGRIVRSCHERWDGGGYPDGLAGAEIPLVARIVCCCDAFNAMTTDRSYRKALPLEEAKAELVRCRGTQFDAEVVDALLAVLEGA
jgi:HD-GYP domain-containing protein (c-di-GMP phosphodiesterase class II)